MEQGVLQWIKETGGFCLPDFVKKGVNVWFTVDNFDLLEDADWTEHIPWHSDRDQPASRRWRACQPTAFHPREASLTVTTPGTQVFEVKYLQEQIIKTKLMRFEVRQLGKRKTLISKDFTHTWALANYFATDDSGGESPNDLWRMKSSRRLKSGKVKPRVKMPEILTTLFFQ